MRAPQGGEGGLKAADLSVYIRQVDLIRANTLF